VKKSLERLEAIAGGAVDGTAAEVSAIEIALSAAFSGLAPAARSEFHEAAMRAARCVTPKRAADVLLESAKRLSAS
jgi:hypothetical protein